MDGTLTAPLLDFPKIKAEMGIGNRQILEALAEMTATKRKAAQEILDRHEDHAAANSTLNPGCHELLTWAAERSIGTALITRNSRRSTQTVLSLHSLDIDVLITRDDAPFKPDPRPLLLACDRLGVSRTDAWMIGDGAHDMDAGRAAEIRTVWISHGQDRPFATEPWRAVPDLNSLLDLLNQCATCSASA
jgi:HAD superfamily hydrolase (TIGR01549 family)